MNNIACFEKIKSFFLNSPLRRKITSGVLWLGFGNGTENAFRFLRNMVLARLLLPGDFGLMAIILSFNALLSSVTQIGIKESIIQSSKGDQKSYLNASFWLSFIRGLILFIAAVSLSPFIGSFFNNVEIIPLIRLSFLAVVFDSLISPRAYVSLKKMDYKKWIFIINIGSITGILFSIIFGWYLRNAWALILGFVIESLSRCVLSFFICPFSPDFKFEKETLHDLFTFTKRVIGLSFVYYLYLKVDIFFLAKICSSEKLGVYDLAQSLSNFPHMIFTTIIHPLILSLVAQNKNNENLPSKIYQLTEYNAILFLPLLTVLMLLSPVIIKFSYGMKYIDGTVPFIIFCGSLMLITTFGMLNTVFIAIGRPDTARVASIIRLVSLTIIVYPLVLRFGIIGAASARFISSLIWVMVTLIVTKKIINISIIKYILSCRKGVLISISFIIIYYSILYIYYLIL